MKSEIYAEKEIYRLYLIVWETNAEGDVFKRTKFSMAYYNNKNNNSSLLNAQSINFSCSKFSWNIY